MANLAEPHWSSWLYTHLVIEVILGWEDFLVCFSVWRALSCFLYWFEYIQTMWLGWYFFTLSRLVSRIIKTSEVDLSPTFSNFFIPHATITMNLFTKFFCFPNKRFASFKITGNIRLTAASNLDNFKCNIHWIYTFKWNRIVKFRKQKYIHISLHILHRINLPNFIKSAWHYFWKNLVLLHRFCS